MPTLPPELTTRAARLKRMMVADAVRRFRPELQARLKGPLQQGDYTSDEILVIDDFLFAFRLPDRRLFIDWCTAQHPELSGPDRTLLLSWKGAVLGVFRILRRDGFWLDAHDEVADLPHRFALDPLRDTSAFQPGMFIFSRAVPAGEVWLWSGSQIPIDDEASALETAADLAQRSHASFFRNPKHLADALAMESAERALFVERFGAPFVAGTPAEVEVWWNEFTDAWQARALANAARASSPKAVAARLSALGLAPLPKFELPEPLRDCRSVGLVFFTVGGLHLLPEYGDLLAAFAEPGALQDPAVRESVVGLLASESVGPDAFRLPALRWPEGASAVFQYLNNKPKFNWQRHGEALLQRHKPWAFEEPPLPGVTPLRPELIRALARAQRRRAVR